MPTFETELSDRLNRWFQLIPKGCQAAHVRHMLTKLECGEDDRVLDPFCGEGTTLVECQLAGIPSVGFEINPFLHFVSSTLTNWQIEQKQADSYAERVASRFTELGRSITFETLASHGLQIPAIPNLLSWWRKDVLTDLLVLKTSILQTVDRPPYRDFFLLALASVLVPELSNVKLELKQLYQIDRHDDDIRVLDTFESQRARMVADLPLLAALGPRPRAEACLQDCTDLTSPPTKEPISCVVTSPPYAERYSYVWNTLPHLYLFGHHTKASESGKLDESTIGGTWGPATFNLMRGEIPPDHPVIERVVGPLVSEVRKSDNLGANYLMKYFNLLTRHILALEQLPQRNLRLAYMIGTAQAGGLTVPTDQLLGQILERLDIGYKVREIEDHGPCLGDNEELRHKMVFAWKR